MEEDERIQHQAALAITGAWQGSNRLKIYEELDWETLSDRRLNKRIQQVHKMVKLLLILKINCRLTDYPFCGMFFEILNVEPIGTSVASFPMILPPVMASRRIFILFSDPNKSVFLVCMMQMAFEYFFS